MMDSLPSLLNVILLGLCIFGVFAVMGLVSKANVTVG